MRTRPLVLILVEAPFQLMCAIEFMKERNENDYELVFIETNSKENTKHFLQLIDLFQIGTSVENVVSFEIIPRRNNFLFIVSLFIKSLQTRRKKYAQIVIGDYRSSYVRIIESRLEHDCVVLDDGISLLDSYKGIESRRKVLFSESYGNRFLATLVKDVSKEYVLYTMLPKIFLERLSVENKTLKILGNNFSFLRSMSSKYIEKSRTRDVMVIGGPLTELKIIGEDVFERCLLRLRDKYNDRNVIYIAHRRDSEEKLSWLENKLNIKVKNFSRSLEIELTGGRLQPGIFYTFSSAALFTVSLLSKSSECYFFKLDAELISSEYLKSFSMVYELLEHSAKGVKIGKL